MALLANNTLASPGLSFYALAGGGGGDTLQSPVNLIPEAGGNQELNIVASTGTGEATIVVASSVANANVGMTLGTAFGGNAALVMGETTVPNSAVALVYPGAVVGGGELNIENVTSGLPIAVFDTINNAVVLGNGTTSGQYAVTTIKNGLKVADTPVTASANGIGITMTASNTGIIAGTDATGVTNTLYLGSSQGAPEIIELVDTGAGTAECKIGGNGGENLSIQGGSLVSAKVIMRTDAVNNGVLILGASQANGQLMFLKDQTAAGTGVVDVTNGTAASVALRLQANTPSVPGANTVRLSTNLPFAGSNAGGQVRITTAYDGGGVLQNYTGIELQEANGTTYTTIYDQTYNSNPAQNPVGIAFPYNTYNTLSASMADQVSVAIPSLPLSDNYRGLYAINIYTTSTDIQSLSASISSIAYWDSTSGWIGGAAGAVTPNGNVRIVPSVSVGVTSLAFANFSGNTITNMKYSITNLTGRFVVKPG